MCSVLIVALWSLFFQQPVKEEKVEESTEKSPEDTKTATEGEGAEEEQQKEQGQEAEIKAEGDPGEAQTSLFQSPLRLVRKNKMKLAVCHVTLLDGTDFTCEVEVRHNIRNVQSIMDKLHIEFAVFTLTCCMVIFSVRETLDNINEVSTGMMCLRLRDNVD